MSPFTDYRILFLLVIPIVTTVIFLYRSNSVKYNGWRKPDHSDFNLFEAGISLIVLVSITIGGWYLGRSLRINNFKEQIGGFVTEHYSVDGDHQESYECNCSTDKDGHRTCSTCYRTVYHREFYVKTNIGDWFWGGNWSQRVDKSCQICEPYYVPGYYSNSYVGKSVSLDNYYPNYIAAAGEDMYNQTYGGLASTLPDICPQESDYRVSDTDVVKAMPIGFEEGSQVAREVFSWNFYGGDGSWYNESITIDSVPLYMNTLFGYLGGEVQGDTHIYVVNSKNVGYSEMCLAKWKNGAKNSIYIFIFGEEKDSHFLVSDVKVSVAVDGSKDNKGIDLENEEGRSNYYLKFDTRKELMDYFKSGGSLNREGVLKIVSRNVNNKFIRQEMSSFEELKNYVVPRNGWIVFMGVVILIVDLALHFYFSNNDL